MTDTLDDTRHAYDDADHLRSLGFGASLRIDAKRGEIGVALHISEVSASELH